MNSPDGSVCAAYRRRAGVDAWRPAVQRTVTQPFEFAGYRVEAGTRIFIGTTVAHFIPELHWPFGYPLAILLMIVSAILPYSYFKHKGWL